MGVSNNGQIERQVGKLRRLRPMVVAGTPRSGTTWSFRIMCASREMTCIWEPFNPPIAPRAVRSLLDDRYFLYVGAENEARYLDQFVELMRYRYHHWSDFDIRSLRNRDDLSRWVRDVGRSVRDRWRSRRPLLKAPYGAFSVPWFVERFDGQALVLLRRPEAFVGSLKLLNWIFNVGEFLHQPLLMQRYLEPFRGEIEQMARCPDDLVGHACLLWRCIYSAVRQYSLGRPEIHVVRHEDLSADPMNAFRDLYARFELTFSQEVVDLIEHSTSSRNPSSSEGDINESNLNTAANLHNWKSRLDASEIDRVRRLTADVASLYGYEGGEVVPWKTLPTSMSTLGGE